MARGASFNAVGCHVEYTYHGMARVRTRGMRTRGMRTMRVSSFFGSSRSLSTPRRFPFRLGSAPLVRSFRWSLFVMV